MSVFVADGRSYADFIDEARKGILRPPDPTAVMHSVVVIPTTFAGAADSSGGSIEVLGIEGSPTEYPIRTGDRTDRSGWSTIQTSSKPRCGRRPQDRS
ncbi:hypothetical protein [Natronorarus salvus]|uniref:hypothetical protein n=1 Tax=Natronorarus salvus TaxID=3117733 RepID=UPI003907E7D6